MALVHTPRLNLVEHDHRDDTATLKVNYTLHQSALERNLDGLRYRETIQLWGADDLSADDYLYTFPTRYFSNASSTHIDRERTVTISEDILDEDDFWLWNPSDQVYAKVCVEPQMPRSDCTNSNEISHSF